MPEPNTEIEQAFVEMVTEHQGIIHKVCGIYCRQPNERADLFQEILLQLWRAYPNFKGRAKASTWMYRIAINTAVTQFRRQERRPPPDRLPQDMQLADTPADTLLQERLALLHRAIERLDKIEKALVMLYLEECSYQQIAQIMGISESNVGVKLHRIKGKLKKIMTG